MSQEEEFLFAPYSTFTVRSVEVVSKPSVNEYEIKHHTIHLDVASDNLNEPLDLPLSPWA